MKIITLITMVRMEYEQIHHNIYQKIITLVRNGVIIYNIVNYLILIWMIFLRMSWIMNI